MACASYPSLRSFQLYINILITMLPPCFRDSVRKRTYVNLLLFSTAKFSVHSLARQPYNTLAFSDVQIDCHSQGSHTFDSDLGGCSKCSCLLLKQRFNMSFESYTPLFYRKAELGWIDGYSNKSAKYKSAHLLCLALRSPPRK